MSRPILVLGASGFLGRHIVKALQEARPGVPIIKCGRQFDANAEYDARGLRVDLADDSSTAPFDALIATKPSIIVNCSGLLRGTDEDLAKVNFIAVRNLADRLAESVSDSHLIQLGSAAEYRMLEFGQKTTENTETNPGSAYGKSKLQATRYLGDLAHSGRLTTTVLRIFNPIGSGMNPATLPGRVQQFLLSPSSDSLPLGDLGAFRDFVDVRDVASAVVAATVHRTAATGEVFNIGSGHARTSRELVRDLFRSVRDNLSFTEDQSGSQRSAHVAWQEADINKAQRQLGWLPTRTWEDMVKYAVQ